MRTQQLLSLCGLLLASSVAIASKLDYDDVPNRCWAACDPVVGIAKSCDGRYDGDSAEIQCICDWDRAKTQIPLCSACITQYQNDMRNNNITYQDQDHDDDDDDHDHDDHDDDYDDNEALELVRSCSLTTTTYNSAATATTLTGTSTGTAASNTVTATETSSTGGTNNQDSPSSISSGSSDSASASSGSASAATATPDAAAGISAPGAAPMAGVMGLMALAWL